MSLKLIIVAVIHISNIFLVLSNISQFIFHFIMVVKISVVIAFCTVGQNSIILSLTVNILLSDILKSSVWVCMPVCSVTVVSDSLQLYGPQPTRLLCLWDFPSKNAKEGWHFLLQGIFLSQGLNQCLLIAGRFFATEPPGKPIGMYVWCKLIKGFIEPFLKKKMNR